jgi:molybdate transport system substrate-binding protein
MRLRFLSAGAAQGVVAALAAKHAIGIDGSFGAVGAMREKFLAGEACDVVILPDAQIAELASAGRVRADTAGDLGAVATSIAVRAADPAPFVSDEASLRAALVAADAIYFPDPAKSTAGIHFAGILDRLGLAAALADRLKTFPNGATAMRAMAAAVGRPIGCTQATEIVATPGVRLVAPLPRGFDLETVYTAAVADRAERPEAARRFVETLAGESSRPLRTAAGFHGNAIRVASPGDAQAIREVVRIVLAEYGLAPDPAGTDGDLGDIAASYFARGGLFDVVVADDGRVVGCCGVYRVDETTCELRKMYVLREDRGQGLGARLLRRAIAFARGRGFRRMELETASLLKVAIGLYERSGFRPAARARLASRCDQGYALDL